MVFRSCTSGSFGIARDIPVKSKLQIRAEKAAAAFRRNIFSPGVTSRQAQTPISHVDAYAYTREEDPLDTQSFYAGVGPTRMTY